MTLGLALRKVIESWLSEGKEAPEIYSLLKTSASRATIYRWVNRILESGIEAHVSPGRTKTVRTIAFVAKVKRIILSGKSGSSLRKIAKKEGCSTQTVHRILHKDLLLKAYKKIRVPCLTAAHIRKRLKFSIWVRNRFTLRSSRKIMFSDEKMFCQHG